jgi:lipoprotein-anchoring transpeptidase ErfK/SrfK
MKRVLLPALLSVFTAAGAAAGPLSLQPDGYQAPSQAPSRAYAQARPAPRGAYAPAPAQPVASSQAYGGGFIEMLFGGPGAAAPTRYQPNAMVGPSGAPAEPAVDPRYMKQEVAYSGPEKPGTVVVNTNDKFLYLVQDGGRAIRYGIGVGRPGFTWAGVHHVSQKREWPDWTPPAEMLARRPDLPRHMVGGPENPLGARAMYLGSTLYRIHGSNEPWTIGTQVSSGCIRMRNEDVIDLYSRVKVGAKVIVS